MTTTDELNNLIAKATERGATVDVEWDSAAELIEGRKIHRSIRVSGLRGCGPHPMAPIYAAERLREILN